MANSSDEWIWTKADQADWDLIREHLVLSQKVLGIHRQHDVHHSTATTLRFIRGPITLMYGERSIVTTRWTSTPQTCSQMDCPESFQVSGDMVDVR